MRDDDRQCSNGVHQRTAGRENRAAITVGTQGTEEPLRARPCSPLREARLYVLDVGMQAVGQDDQGRPGVVPPCVYPSQLGSHCRQLRHPDTPSQATPAHAKHAQGWYVDAGSRGAQHRKSKVTGFGGKNAVLSLRKASGRQSNWSNDDVKRRKDVRSRVQRGAPRGGCRC